MRRAHLPIIVFAVFVLLFAAPGLAIREKAAMGVWTWRDGEREVDTIRLKKHRIFDRQILRYEPVEVEILGEKRTIMKLAERTVDKGRWAIVEKRVRLLYSREVDGEEEVRDGDETAHTAFLAGRDGKLVLEEQNDEALPEATRRTFEKTSPSD